MLVITLAVVLLSLSFLIFIRMLINMEWSRELKHAENEIFQKLENLSDDETIAPSFGGTLGEIPKLPYYITYLIYDSDDFKILATNDPFLPFLEDSHGKAKRYFAKDYFFDGDLNIIYYAQAHTNPQKHNIVISTARNMDDNFNEMMLEILPTALLLMSIPILAFSFLISLLITKNTIRPVKRITKAAQSVTIENLSDLLPISGYDDEIDELSKTFNSLFLRLKRDFDRERQFSSDVSHELNTPLTVISGQTGLLLRWGKNDPVQLEKSLNAIKTEAKTMQSIIANLLQISRIESGRIKPQILDVSIENLFSWLVEEFKAISPKVKIFCESNELSLRTDSEMLHQILTVLVSNSVKYAGEDCNIKLRAEKKFDHIIIEEIDDGPGFSSEALPHIFERFYRADESHSRKIAGSGLGLSIALTLCNALGVKIKARNMIPHGAGFIIEF